MNVILMRRGRPYDEVLLPNYLQTLQLKSNETPAQAFVGRPELKRVR